MQAFIQHLSTKQIHENAHTAEKHSQADIEGLEYCRENSGVFSQIATVLFIDAFHLTVDKYKRKVALAVGVLIDREVPKAAMTLSADRKSTRLNSSHSS